MSYSEILDVSPDCAKRMRDCGMISHPLALSLDRLRETHVTYFGFEGDEKIGSLIVLDVIAPVICQLFNELHAVKFPLFQIMPICVYAGSDTLSMQKNNSSAYNPRYIGQSDEISIHSFGMSLDINPVQNPYIGLGSMEDENLKIAPVAGKDFINRHVKHPAMVEDVVPLFKKYGFIEWGGDWTERRVDYHHFQVPYNVAYLCSRVFSPDHATQLFAFFLENPQKFCGGSDQDLRLVIDIAEKKGHDAALQTLI
ncbi:MAG: M15 family metallopeptidase [Pseudomonadota bacterium]